MEDPEKTEVEDKESQAINNGRERGSNELSQQSASLDIASGETAETESTALPKEGENEESLECSQDTKSGKKKKKTKKKKAEMTNVTPDNTEQLLSTLTADVEETSGNIDSATKGQTSGKECEKLDPTEDSPANKKKKKKKKKTESKVCGTLGKQLDNQDVSSAPKKEKSVEDQSDLAVAKNGKQENDADTKSQKECGDAVSSDIGNERENVSEDSPADREAARTEEGNVPALEKDDRSSSEMVPDELKPELATISHGAKESDSDTDMPEKEDAMESDSADNSSDEPDNEG